MAETGSRAGLLYGVEQVGKTHIVVWGALPQSDGGLLIIDGSNRIPDREWAEFLETIRIGMLHVNKIVKGQHPCRTRVLFIGNPGNPPEALSTYRRSADALVDMFTDPMIARLDVAVPFGVDDVPIDTINTPNHQLTQDELDELATTLRANVTHAWSVNPDDLKFTNETERALLEEATSLYQEFKDARVPVVTNDLKKKLARETISLALLCGRTTATKQDVDYVVREFREICQKLGLGNRKTVDPALVASWLTERCANDNTMKGIVEFLSQGETGNKQEIADRLGVDYRTVGGRLAELKRNKLAHSKKQVWEATDQLMGIASPLAVAA